MINLDSHSKNFNANPLLRNIPDKSNVKSSVLSRKTKGDFTENYTVKINLESVHYSGKDYGYGWTFIVSTLKRHWISNRIHIQRGRKSPVNKKIYHNLVNSSFYNLQHLPITICVQHISGYKVETTLQLKPNAFKRDLLPKSIFTEIEKQPESFQFNELHSIDHNDAQFMFVLNFEITPEGAPGYKN